VCIRVICAFTALALLVGCAIHPLPEDVTRVTSFDIVRQIRCETRDTIREIVIGWLETLATYEHSVRAQQLAAQYRADPASIRTFHYDLFNTPDLVHVRATAKLFYDTGIAYNFDLTGTEDNNLSADVNLLRQQPFLQPLSKFSLALNAGAQRRRANERTFTITDTFSGLLTQVTEAFCEGQVIGPNYIYPISGRIGVDRLINDFIHLTLFGNLTAGGAKPGDAPGIPAMVDNLTFTTTITASATPRIEFTPVTATFQLLNAQLAAVAARTDVHKVTVGVAITTSGIAELAPLRAYLFGAGATVRGQTADPGGVIVGARVIGGGSPSERLAVIAVDQIKSREVQLIPPP
jgi:hypothetical protein